MRSVSSVSDASRLWPCREVIILSNDPGGSLKSGKSKFALLLISAVAIPLSISIIAVLLLYYSVGPDYALTPFRIEMRKEVVKIFLQLGAIGVLGGLIAALFNYVFTRYAEIRRQTEEKLERDRVTEEAERERNRARTEAENEFRKDFLRKFINTHAQVQRVTPLIVGAQSARTYGEQMRALIDVRNQLDEIIDELETGKNLFDQWQDIRTLISSMNTYLLALVQEYGKDYPALSNLQGEAEQTMDKIKKDELKKEVKNRIDNLLWLAEFMKTGEKYKAEYLEPYNLAKRKIRETIWRAIGIV